MWTRNVIYLRLPPMIELRDLNPQNFENIHQIFPGNEGKYWVNFNWYWTNLSRRNEMIVANLIYWKNSGLPVGFVAFGRHFKDRQLKIPVAGAYELYHMVIDVSEQGKGIGRTSTVYVLRAMANLDDCKQLVVACHPDNKSATALYFSLGFQNIGKNYDDDPLYALDPKKIPDLKLNSFPGSQTQRPRNGAAEWSLESIQSEKEFDWTAWENGFEI